MANSNIKVECWRCGRKNEVLVRSPAEGVLEVDLSCPCGVGVDGVPLGGLDSLIFRLFRQSCLKAGSYDHMFLGAYQDAQAYLVWRGLVKQEECVHPWPIVVEGPVSEEDYCIKAIVPIKADGSSC